MICYRHNVADYLSNKNLLESDIKTWVNNYTNYPEGINNAGIAVSHLTNENLEKQGVSLSPDIQNQKFQLENGDVIKFGDKEITLSGKNGGYILSPWDSIPVFQLIKEGNTSNGVSGLIEFTSYIDDNGKEVSFKISEQEESFYCKQNNDTNAFVHRTRDANAKTDITIIRNGKVVARGTIYNCDTTNL